MKKKISILIVMILAVNTLLGTMVGADGTVGAMGLTEVGPADTGLKDVSSAVSMIPGTSSLNRSLLAAQESEDLIVSPAEGSQNVPIDTKLEVNFADKQIRANPNKQQIYTISRDMSGYTEKMDVTVTQSTYANSVILTPPSYLLYGTKYYITIPEGTFISGGVGNGENGVTSSALTWSFTTASSSTTALTPTAFSPSNGSVNIRISVNPIIKFNRNVKLNTGLVNGGITLRKTSNDANIPISVAVSSNIVTITPTSKLEQGTSYYIEIANNGIYDAQNPSLYYAGLSGKNSWSFQTEAAPDKTAPVLQSATMYSNTTIRLMYNETLYYSNYLSTASFTVTVNGETRRISSVDASGESVYVYLETGVAVGQDVKISYTGSGSQAIKDLAGNAAATFSSKLVTNGIDSVMPKPREGYATSTSVTLYFSESIKSPSSYAYQQFTVTADGNSRGISSMSHSGNTITLYLSSSISNGQVVKVSYAPGSYPLEDNRGMNIAAFSDYFVQNRNDNVAPVFKGAEGSGNKIIMTYDEALRTSTMPPKSYFSVLVNNTPVYVTAVEIVSNQVILTLASSFTKDQSVTLSYVSGYGGVADLNGNLAGYINLQPITYKTVIEGIRSATITGDTLTITFNSTLRTVSYLPANQFYVNVDKVNRGLQSATISGNTVTLKLSSAVTNGQVIDLSYMTGTAPLYDSLGNIIKSFNNLQVQNLTGGTTTTLPSGVQPDYLTTMSDFGVGAYLLNLNTAQASSSQSRFGLSIKKYMIDNDKLQVAFKYLADNNIVNRKLVFEVPSTEKAAEVAVPLGALMSMYNSGKTGSIAVKYNNVMYELPIEKISFPEISRSLSASSLNSAYINIQIEPVTKVQMPSLNYNNSVTTAPVGDPVQIYVSAYNGTSAQNAVDVEHTGQIYFKASGSSSSMYVSLMKYDLVARTASFVPGKITGSGSQLVFSGKVNGNSVIGPATGYSYFSDTAKHWAKSDITELGSKLIIDSRNGDKFEPDKNITRAEFAVFIAKGLGLTGDISTASRFSDISSGSTIAAYIGAAAKAGIINGNTDGTFKPNSNITREQMALMMVRAMEYAGYDTSLKGSSTVQILTKFKDGSKIQSKETVAKAVKEGIIQGVTSNIFQPKGNATRAQAAVMLKRVLDKLDYL